MFAAALVEVLRVDERSVPQERSGTPVRGVALPHSRIAARQVVEPLRLVDPSRLRLAAEPRDVLDHCGEQGVPSRAAGRIPDFPEQCVGKDGL